MMAVAVIALHLIVGFGPDRVEDRFIGIFLKALSEEFGTGVASLDEQHAATGFFDR